MDLIHGDATQCGSFGGKQPLPIHEGSLQAASESNHSRDSDSAALRHRFTGGKQPRVAQMAEYGSVGNTSNSSHAAIIPALVSITTSSKRPLPTHDSNEQNASISDDSYASTIVAPYHKVTGSKRLPQTYISSDPPPTHNVDEHHNEDSDPSSSPSAVVTPTLSAYCLEEQKEQQHKEESSWMMLGWPKLVVRNAAEYDEQLLRDLAVLARNEQ